MKYLILLFLFSFTLFSESEKELNQLLSLLEKESTQNQELEWGAAKSLLSLKGERSELLFEKLEALAIKNSTEESYDFLLSLYKKHPNLRVKKLEWVDSGSLDEGSNGFPATTFVLSVIAQSEDSIEKSDFDLKGKNIRDLILVGLNRDMEGKTEGVFESMNQWLRANFNNPEDASKRQSQAILIYSLCSNPIIIKKIFEPEWGNAAYAKLHNLLAEKIEKLPNSPIWKFFTKQVSLFLLPKSTSEFNEVNLTFILDKAKAPETLHSEMFFSGLPDYPGLNKQVMLNSYGSRAYGMPYPTAQLTYDKKTISGQAVDVYSIDTRIPHRKSPYDPYKAIRQATSEDLFHLNAKLSFRDSTNEVGVYYQPLKTVMEFPGNKKLEMIREGIEVDAYTTRTGAVEVSKPTPKDFRFWVAITRQIQPGVKWLGVRFTTDSTQAPLAGKLSPETREKIIRNEDINPKWDGNLPYSFWEEARQPELWFDRIYNVYIVRNVKEPGNDNPTGKLSHVTFKKIYADLFKDHYGLPHADPINCLGGCLTNQAVALEPKTGWQIFKVEPDLKNAVILQTDAYPLISYRSPYHYNMAGGFTPNAFDIIEFKDRDSSEPLFEEIDLLDIGKSTKYGLLSYTEALNRGFSARRMAFSKSRQC